MAGSIPSLLFSNTPSPNDTSAPDNDNNHNNSPPTMENQFINDAIASHTAVIFSKTWCGYCSRTKQLLAPLVSDMKIIELDELPNGDAIQQELKKISGQSTVPNVYVRGQHLGGNDDTHSAHRSGKLQKLLDGN